ncbi:MAG: aquaporin [Pseudolabrys sp.]|nr:aquaporin [Pseudolabrys sp.]
MTLNEQRALAAEFAGTFTLVSAVCGAALFSAPSAGLVAVAFAVGFSVLAMAFAVGHVSGGHFNPAVTIGLVAGGRFDSEKALLYIVAQVAGGIAAAFVFWLILKGALPGGRWNTFLGASNTYASGNGFSMPAVFLIEAVITALFMMVIMGATSAGAPVGFAPIAIGLALVLFHLAAIPVSNASLNPARSTATALFAGGEALTGLWLFWVAPIIGGAAGGYAARWLLGENPRRALPMPGTRRRRRR